MILKIDSEEIEHEIETMANPSEKPVKYAIQDYPLNSVSDRHFELLLYLILKRNDRKLIKNLEYDTCSLTIGAGDQGRDVSLYKVGVLVGIVQCKKFSKNLNITQVLTEILKTSMNLIQEEWNGEPKSKIQYYIAVSNGFTKESSDFIDTFPKSLLPLNEEIKNTCATLSIKYKKLNNPIKDDSSALYAFLKSMTIGKILPIDICNAISTDSNIISLFFSVQHVINKDAFETILKENALNITLFKKSYSECAIAVNSRVNFLGLSTNRKPNYVELEKIFVTPRLKLRGGRTNKTNYSSVYKEIFSNFEWNLKAETFSMPSKEWIPANIFDNIDFKNISIGTNFLEYFDNANWVFGNTSNEFNFSELFKKNRNIIILGKPGAGKSSLVKYALCHILTIGDKIFSNYTIYNRIPIRIDLKNYNAFRMSKMGGFAQYIACVLQTDFQLSFITQNSIPLLLANYDTLIFFDGFDEVTDDADRSNIRTDIEAFCKNHQHVRALITSRYEAYDDVPFNEQDFDVYELCDFNEEQVNQFVLKWYAIEEENKDVREIEQAACLHELAGIEAELRHSPLLLTLIVIIYRANQSIPTTKLEIYESCTNTIVDTRDSKEKKLTFALKIRNKTALFASLAYWLYERFSNKKPTVEYEVVKKHIQDYLINKNEFEDVSEAEEAAKQFLDFARQRSVFIDNSFTHKTFLEYYASYFLFSSYHSKGYFKELNQILSDKITDPAWSVILEMLLCRIDRDQTDSEVIDEIVTLLLQSNQLNALQLLLHTLKYLNNVGNNIKKDILLKGFKSCLSLVGTAKQDETRRAINSAVINLSIQKSFFQIASEIIQVLFEEMVDTSEKTNFVVFLLENAISTPEFSALLPKTNFLSNVVETEYLFILLHYPKLSDRTYFKEQLTRFASKYGNSNVFKPYTTKYVHNIFSGNNRFSWIPFILFRSIKFEDFLAGYALSTTTGFSNGQIEYAIKLDTGTLNIEIETLLQFAQKVRKPNLKKIINVAISKYGNCQYLFQDDQHKPKPFYDKKQNPKRRFPRPI